MRHKQSLPRGLTLLLLLLASLPAQAMPRVVVMLLPGLRVEDLTRSELPALRRFLQEGAAGWLVCREARTTNTEAQRANASVAAVLTLGAGARAQALTPPPSRLADLPAAMTRWQAENALLDHPVAIGTLGDTVHRLKRQTAALVNANPARPLPDAFLLTADSQGHIDMAPNLLTHTDAHTPYSAYTDALLVAYDRLPPAVALVVVEADDVSHCNALLERLAPRLRGTLVVLLSPAPTPASSRLAFVCLWGQGIAPGTLASPSTRWPGLAVNTDILPTIAQALNTPALRGTAGRPLASLPTQPATPESLVSKFARLQHTARLQNLFGGLPTVQLLLVLSGVGLAWRRPGSKWANAIAAAIVALPLALLLLPPVAPASPLAAGLLLALVVSGIALFAAHITRPLALFYALCALLLFSIVLDLLAGSHLLRVAWMSYSILEGARYYGIGNEYMGAVIGAACLLTAFCPHVSEGGKRGREFTVALCLMALVLVLGIPGAKVGAIPSAGCAFGALLLVRERGSLRARDMIVVALVVLLALFAFAAFDLRHGVSGQSHLARAVAGEGGDTLFGIARRKLLLEGYLLLHSAWSPTLFVSGFACLWLRRQHASAFTPRALHAAYVGLFAGAAASLLCNDSGLTAAVLCLLFAVAWSLLLTVQETPAKK